MEENNGYEDLLEVIKNRYPNSRATQYFAKCKSVLSCHGIKKRRSVAEGTFDTRSV